MVLTDITTTAEIRAVLGVSEKEIRDAVLERAIYTTQLSEDLLATHPDIYTGFVTAKAASPQSANQLRFTNLMEAYAAYFIAGVCLGSIAMFAPRSIKDDRSEVQRTDDPFSALRTDVPATLSRLKTRMLLAYEVLNPAATVPAATARKMVVASPLGIDPVVQ